MTGHWISPSPGPFWGYFHVQHIYFPGGRTEVPFLCSPCSSLWTQPNSDLPGDTWPLVSSVSRQVMLQSTLGTFGASPSGWPWRQLYQGSWNQIHWQELWPPLHDTSKVVFSSAEAPWIASWTMLSLCLVSKHWAYCLTVLIWKQIIEYAELYPKVTHMPNS